MADDNIQALIAELSLNTRRIEGQQNRLLKSFDKTMGGIEKTGSKRLTNVEKRAEQMSRNVRRAIVAIGVGVAGREVLEYEASWRATTNTLKQYTDVLGPAQQSASALNKIASDARAPLSELGGLTGAAARSARDLGKSGADVLIFGEAAAKGARLANTGGAAVQGAFTQLSQAIASPRVQLQEFNSIIEGTPRLAQAFADGVDGAGGSVAKLRKMIADGDVSGGVLFDALISQIGKLRTEFKTLDQGPAEAVTRLQNKLTEFIGTNGRVKDGTAALTAAIDFLADNLDGLTDSIIIGGAALAGFFGAQGALAVAASLNTVAVGATNAAKAMAVLRAASAAMMGPAGIIIGVAALAAGFAYLAINADKSTAALGEYGGAVDEVTSALDAYEEAQLLATKATGDAKEDAVALAAAKRDEAKATLDAAEAKLAEAKAELVRRQSRAENARKRVGSSPSLQNGGLVGIEAGLSNQYAAATALEEKLAEARARMEEITNPTAATVPDTSAGGGRSGGTTDPDKKELAAIKSIEDAYANAFLTKRELAERAYKEELSQIASLSVAQTEKDALAEKALKLRDKAISDAAAEEQESIAALMDARDAAAGNEVAIINRRAKAAKAAAETEVVDAETRAQKIALIEEQRVADIKAFNDKEAADKQKLIEQVLGARAAALGDYVSLAEVEYQALVAKIDKEISAEEGKFDILRALEEAHLETVKDIRARMADDRLQEALQEADTIGEGFRAQWDIMRAETEKGAGDIGILFADTFGPGGAVQEAIGQSAGRAIAFGDDFSESMENAARSIASNLISALVAYGVQLVAQAALGQTLGATAVAATTAQAAVSAAAWAPAAAAASLATLGANAAPAAAALTSTHALSQALSLVPGFKDGVIGLQGPGTGRSDSINIRASKGESIITEEGTRKNANLLKLINAGVDVEAQVARASEPLGAAASFLTGGGRQINVAGSRLNFYGPVDREAVPAFREALDQKNRELVSTVEQVIYREQTVTTPRHERKRIFRR